MKTLLKKIKNFRYSYKQQSMLFLVILLSMASFSQSREYNNCEEAKAIALEDFNNGIYLCKNIEYVKFKSPDYYFEQFFSNLIFSKYNIIIDNFDYKITEKDFCYSNTMDSLVYQMHGKDIYKRFRAEAKDIYLSTNEQQWSKLLDLSKTYTHVDSYPKFIGNDKTISNYLRKTFGEAKNTDFNAIGLTIGIDGTIEDLKSNFEFPHKVDKSKLLEELNQLGTFVPGYLFGIKVKSKTWFYF